MNSLNSTLLINFLGFTVGAALYGILLLMVFRHPVLNNQTDEASQNRKPDSLLLITAILGLLWNFINLFEIVGGDLMQNPFPPYLSATAFAALGFLPALIIGSEWRTAEDMWAANIKRLSVGAYLLSGFAGVLHFYSAVFYNFSPSAPALWILTGGYLLILAALFTMSRQTSIERKSVWATALAIFAVSAFHLSHPHTDGENSWFVEFIGHQASLAFIFVILYQNFRFAFADLFLKRAFSLLLLTALVFGLYAFAAVPLLALHQDHLQPDTTQISVNLLLWIITALIYPTLHNFAVWLVDKILLRRADYAVFKKEIAQNLAAQESISAALEQVRERLTVVLTAKKSAVTEINENLKSTNSAVVKSFKNKTEIIIPTADAPQYNIVLRELAGGRNLLSEEFEMLEDVASQTARRIDILRVSHERCERELREQEFSGLATEAELRVLRAQINPHFLFNALTTIGYLINTAPEKAFATLMQLTGLLRGALRSAGEFQTLGEELKLITTYLEIEKARFEERLQVGIDLPQHLETVRIPALILQPLVENAVKHGISNKKDGGTISISVCENGANLVLQVCDTGTGIEKTELRRRMKNRVGLKNIEQRLRLYFEDSAHLSIESSPADGTIVKIEIERKLLDKNFSNGGKMRVKTAGGQRELSY